MVDFNKARPHDTLGGKVPAAVYRPSERRSLAPRNVALAPQYVATLTVHTVNPGVTPERELIARDGTG